MLELTVNGSSISLPEVPGEKLSTLLRERLRLTGTKIGCGEGRCGNCIVLLDGAPVRACLTPAIKAQGKDVLTIEGLRALRSPRRQALHEGLQSLHPLQEAFISHGAIQCGFCTPGQILRAWALLKDNPDPDLAEIKAALGEVLCRCGAYESILSAVQSAAKALREDIPVPPRKIPRGADELHAVGQILPRPDAVAKACGLARFTDDLAFDGMLYARVLRAGLPSGFLRRLDVEAARALPGVICVLSAQDLHHARLHGLSVNDWPIFIGLGERVRYVGDAIAAVAAESQELADRAIALIEAEYEPLPVISTPQQALLPESAPLHESGNLLKHIHVEKGDIEEGFAQSSIIVEEVFHTPATDHLFMEPECSIACPREDGGMDVYVGSQIPYADRRQVAAALGLDEALVRVRGQKAGGGFGGKEDIAGQIHASLLAQATGRPVKLLFTRRESLLVHPKRHATTIRVKLGADEEGHLLAAQTELYGDTGAYASLGEVVMTRATTHSCGAYVIPHTRSDCFACYTNNPPAGAFRGFGALQAAFAIESTINILAKKMGLDPMLLRRKNALHVGASTNTGQILRESCGLPECLQAIATRWEQMGVTQPFIPQKSILDGEEVLTCWGLAAAFKNTGLGSGATDSSGATARLMPAGRLQLKTSAAEIGQGLVMALQLIGAEVLGLNPEMVNVYVMDTGLCPDGGPTTASRQTFVSGNAVKKACTELRARILDQLGSLPGWQGVEIVLDEVGAHAEGQSISWSGIYELLAEAEACEVAVRYVAPATSTLHEGGDIHFVYSFAAQAVQIALNLKTGAVKVLQVLASNDAGRVINPLGFQAQVEGGVVMGLGHALMEEFALQEGRVLSDRMARYPIPRMGDSPRVESFIVESMVQSGPFGAKGVGEIVSIPTPPAIANAIEHAIGFRAQSLPIRAEQIRAYLAEHPGLV